MKGRRGKGRDEVELAEGQRFVADLFVHTAASLGGMTFDFGEASVALLDQFADQLWDPAEGRPSEEQLDHLAKLMGSYLGEVMIRNVGGSWVWGDGGRIPAVRFDASLLAYVIDKAYKRQINGRSDDFGRFYDEFKRRAANR
jgi:hypothetical protein